MFEDDIDRLRVAGITFGCNPPANDRYCPGQRVTRAQMASFLGRALKLTPTTPPPRPAVGLVDVVTSGLSLPLHLTAPDGDDRLFVVEQGGTIKVVENGSVTSTFLTIPDTKIIAGGERGLLSMAFHPEYDSNGRFFVYYSAPGGPGNHRSVIAEYTVSGDPDEADAGSEKVVMTVDQPSTNHNGGHLQFGPDGNLYIALGDGGGGNDPHDNGQKTSTLLGSLLRIDVDGGAPYAVPSDNPFVGKAGADEIWAYGLRNPWRFAFDDGMVFIADVGQASVEEVNAEPSAAAGLNYGWRIYEGTRCTGNDGTCSSTGKTFPVVEYSHSQGCSITGGEVYRGSEVSQLVGYYLYTDLCSGFIRAFRLDDGAAVDATDWTSRLGSLSSPVSFGVDGHGELYVVEIGGTIKRFVAVP